MTGKQVHIIGSTMANRREFNDVMRLFYEHPHGFVTLETRGKIWPVVPAPPSRMENRGDEGRYLHETAEESNLH